MDINRSILYELFYLPTNISDEEFKECILEPIWEVIGEEQSFEKTLEIINGFEIIK